jgi:hypothetical protein
MWPPKAFNLRIEKCIERFFEEELKDLYFSKGWLLPPCKRENSLWSNTHFQASLTAKWNDGAFKTVVFTMLNVPGYVAAGNIGNSHVFQFEIPRSYPDNLNAISIVNLTPLWHLRIRPNEVRLPACFCVNGDLDQILRNVIDFVLLRPALVKPAGSDSGFNQDMASWYMAQGPEKVYTQLLALWAKKQIPAVAVRKKTQVVVIG